MDAFSPFMFIPVDDLLTSRVDALRDVFSAYENIEASESVKDKKEWSERLGSDDEIANAKEIIVKSLAKAQESFSKEDFNEALKQNLISAEEMKKIISAKNLNEMREKRSQQSSSKAQKSKSRKQSR